MERGLYAAASGMLAQQTIQDTLAQNIANAQTTRGLNGLPYQRQIVSFESELVRRSASGPSLQSVRVASIIPDRTPGQQVYNPQHPDAGPDGLVTMPNVNLSYEMVDLITASRAYEANLSVAKNARQMALQTLSIGKR